MRNKHPFGWLFSCVRPSEVKTICPREWNEWVRHLFNSWAVLSSRVVQSLNYFNSQTLSLSSPAPSPCIEKPTDWGLGGQTLLKAWVVYYSLCFLPYLLGFCELNQLAVCVCVQWAKASEKTSPFVIGNILRVLMGEMEQDIWRKQKSWGHEFYK